MISMRGENYDKEFSVTRDSVKQNIGQAFRQPEELRCEKVASGFSNDSMVQAYKVYNSLTAKERATLEAEFARLFKNWKTPMEYNFQIKPLSYGSETLISELGGEATKAVVEIIKDQSMPAKQRRAILMKVYGISEDEANNLLMIQEV